MIESCSMGTAMFTMVLLSLHLRMQSNAIIDSFTMINENKKESEV